MAGALNKIWVRFGIYMALVMLLTTGIIAGFIYWNEQRQEQAFLARLPADIHAEMMHLIRTGQENSQRADDIHAKYAPREPQGLSQQILLGLGAIIFLGLIAAFMSARVFVRPLSSVIAAAIRVAQGDLTVRAQSPNTSGELTDLIQNFNYMADTLERLERERRETAAALSHELRTPLTILQGRLHALCDEVIPASNTEFLRLLDHTEHLVRLVDDMHTMSLVEAKRLSLNCTYVELGTFIQELVPFYAHRATGYGVEIVLHTEDTVFVNCDKDRLRQVLANLIENTLHYAASGGLLEISVTQEGDYAVLQLSDRGSGFADGEIEWVFNPFFRGDKSTAKGKPGSGLGLSIVQSIIKQHNGIIQVSNRPEGGACFKMLLPLAANT
jgi:signal transduction histidine kinase